MQLNLYVYAKLTLMNSLKSHILAWAFCALPFLLIAQPDNYKGIGVALRSSVYCPGYFEVTAVLEGGPADAAGVKKNDCVMAVDGKDIKGMALPDLVNIIKGPEGTTVTLSLDGASKREVEVYRGDISPVKMLEQENRKLVEKYTTGEKSGEVAVIFEGIDVMLKATEEHFEPFLDNVEYTVGWADYSWECKEVFEAKHNMSDGRLVMIPMVEFRVVARIHMPFRIEANATGMNAYRNARSILEYWVEKRLKSKGYVVTEFKDKEDDVMTSWFIHKPGDDGKYHKSPQIKMYFNGTEAGKKEMRIKVASAFDEATDNAPNENHDKRRNRGAYAINKYNEECIEGDCISGQSKFTKGDEGNIEYTYVGEMKNGMAHGKGKLVYENQTCEGDFYRGYQEGKHTCKYSNGDIFYMNYDKGIYTGGSSEEYAKALEAQKAKNLRPANSGGSIQYKSHATGSDTDFKVPPIGAQEFIKGLQANGFTVVDKWYKHNVTSTVHHQFTLQPFQSYIAVAFTQSGHHPPKLVVSDLTNQKQTGEGAVTHKSYPDCQAAYLKFGKFYDMTYTFSISAEHEVQRASQPLWVYLLIRP